MFPAVTRPADVSAGNRGPRTNVVALVILLGAIAIGVWAAVGHRTIRSRSSRWRSSAPS